MLRLLLLTYSSNKVQCKRQDDEHQADPLGGLGELGVPGFGLALAEKVSAPPAMAPERPERLPDWEDDDSDRNGTEQLQDC